MHAQSYPTLCNPVDSIPQGFSVHGIFHWNGLPFPSPEDLSNPGTELRDMKESSQKQKPVIL